MNQDKGEYPDISEHPWNRLSERVNRALWEAGLTNPGEIARLSNCAFLKHVPGIGRAALKEIRGVVPNPNSEGPKLIPRPDGRGALLSGGVPGNRGGRGAVPSKVRAASRQGFADLIPRLIDFGQGKTTVTITETCPECGYGGEPLRPEEIDAVVVSPTDQIRAIDVLGKYGLSRTRGVSREDLVKHIQLLGAELQKVLLDRFGEEEAEELCEVIFSRWRKAARERLA